MLSYDFWLYLAAIIVSVILLFMMVWHLIVVDELKNDYRNPMDFAKTLNNLILPEYILHLSLPVVFLLSGCWFSFVLNLPLVVYHVLRYIRRPAMSGPGIYDPTVVMNKDEMSKYTKEGFIKCGFYVVSFLFYLYKMSTDAVLLSHLIAMSVNQERQQNCICRCSKSRKMILQKIMLVALITSLIGS